MIATKTNIKKIEAMEEWFNKNNWCKNKLRDNDKRCTLGCLQDFCPDFLDAWWATSWVTEAITRRGMFKGTATIPNFNDNCESVEQVKEMLRETVQIMRKDNENARAIRDINTVISNIREKWERYGEHSLQFFLTWDMKDARKVFSQVISRKFGKHVDFNTLNLTSPDKEYIIELLEEAKSELTL